MPATDPYTDPDLPLADLLPLRAVVVTLQCTAPSQPRFFHQAALTALLRSLLHEAPGYDLHIRIDTPESGHTDYRPGDYYRFLIIALRGGEPTLAQLLTRLGDLPRGAPRGGRGVPFADNWRLARLQDAFAETPVASVADLSPYTAETLERELGLWIGQDTWHWQWLAPARLLKEKSSRGDQTGEARYCRDPGDLPPALLLARLHDSMADLLRRRAQATSARGAPPPLACPRAHLFWVDNEYRDVEDRDQVMGGLSGRLQLEGRLSPAWWRLLILGQYVGMGQRTAFGFGRYQLRTADGGFSYRRPLPAASLLTLADREDNLAAAWRHVLTGSDEIAQLTLDPAVAWLGDPDADDADAERDAPPPPIETLHADLARLLAGDYQAPELRGFLIPKKDGGLRPLAVPPLRDRVVQRAVLQVLSPAIESLFSTGAHGYRPGHSRITASHAIQAAWRAGYRWVYESDVRDFFDSVDLRRLRERLSALFGEDPVVDAVAAWLAAPVRFQGERIERVNGLPQGSPLSPLMANLMLDDFDSDLQTAGFHLIRFADDFVVLCKDPEEARRAGAAAAASLAEHGLALHPDKTRITAMDQGFRYLGYLFVNDLVVDVSGERGALSKADQVPAHSWLAALAARAAEPVDAEDDLATLIARIARCEPVNLGEADTEGVLLCVTGDPCLIAARDRHLTVLRDDQVVHHLPWRGLQAVILFGNHQITTPALREALRQEVPIHLATGLGAYDGALWSGTPGEHGSGLWLRQTALFSDPQRTLPAAVEVITSRIRHLKETLRLREKGWDSRLVDQALRDLPKVTDAATLLGLEGEATRELYRRIAETLPETLGFQGRNRRPPRDPFNVLLSLGYTLLYGYCESIVRAVGLLPWKGFYHQGRGRHAALASDLMEPFRHVVERAALTVITRGEITPENFSQSPAGGCIIDSAARRKYLALLIRRFETPVTALGDEKPEKLFVHLHRQALGVRTWINEGKPFKAWRMR